MSVVIPTYNRRERLTECLKTLTPSAQGLDSSLYEVIVGIDGYDEQTSLLAKSTIPDVTVVEGPHSGPAATRNRATRKAKGTWICFIDDDCRADAGWLQAILRTAQTNPDAKVIEGRTIGDIQNVDSPFLQAPINETGGAYWSCNLCIERNFFEYIGGFDEDFDIAAFEDMELAYRCKSHGAARLLFCEDATVVHPYRRVGLMAVARREIIITRSLTLFQLKTTEQSLLSRTLPTIAMLTATVMVANYLRCVKQTIFNTNQSNWKRTLFALALNTILFPLQFPLNIYWTIRNSIWLKARAAVHSKPLS